MKYLLLVVAFCGCGALNTPSIDEEVIPYVAVIEELLNTRVTTNIYLVNAIGVVNGKDYTNTHTVGLCIDKKDIVILKAFWNADQCDEYRYSTILHELGHCMYNLNHDTTLDAQGFAASIMNPDQYMINPCITWDYLKYKFKEQITSD